MPTPVNPTSATWPPTAPERRIDQYPDVYATDDKFDFSGTRAFDQANNYQTVSSLTVPMKDHDGRVIGVLQLINAIDLQTKTIVPFTQYMQLVAESLASQAAVSLQTSSC